MNYPSIPLNATLGEQIQSVIRQHLKANKKAQQHRQKQQRVGQMLRQLNSPLTKQLYGTQHAKRTYSVWVTLLSAIRNSKLTWADLSEQPQDLSQGIVWLSQERTTALLAEQGLDYGDLPPILFSLVMSSTNQLYPNALLRQQYVQSAHCTPQVTRMAWAIKLSELPGKQTYDASVLA